MVSQKAALYIYTSHRMAGTVAASFLQAELRRAVKWTADARAVGQAIVVFLSIHESLKTMPRVLSTLQSGGARVIVVYDSKTAHVDLIEAGRQLGAWSFFDARGEVTVLLEQIRSAAHGTPWAQDTVSSTWARALGGGKPGLSPRETAVIESLFVEGNEGPAEVAEHLGMSVNTVRVHLANVRRKIPDRYTGNLDALHDALVDIGWLD